MDGLDYENMSDEDIKYLQEKYCEMIENQKKINDERFKFFSQVVDESKINVNSLDLTTVGKIVFLAKKIFLNTAINFTTGIDPMFLDNGLDNFFSRSRRIQRYTKSDQYLLGYVMTKEFNEGFNKTLEMLRDPDKNKVMEMLKRFDKAYVDLKKSNYVLNDASAYDPQLAYLMVKFLKTLKPITMDRVYAHIDNKYHLGFTNVPQEIIDTIDSMKTKGAKTK